MRTNIRLPLVMVVDDDDAVRELEKRILESGGYRVKTASGAREAFRQLENGSTPDLLIADLDMPELPGEDVVLHLRVSRPALKILYVTANIDRLLAVRPLLLDRESYLDKPFSADGLLDAVATLLGRGQALPARPRRRRPGPLDDSRAVWLADPADGPDHR